MLKLLLSIDKLTPEYNQMIDQLKKHCHVDVCNLTNYSLKNYDIFVGKKLSKNKLNEANKLKIVFAYKTGVDDFPIKELQQKNIPLVNSHASAKLIAEYCFSCCLSLLNHINKFDNNLRQGIWYDKNDMYWESVFDKKIGLLGYGHIGKEIHALLTKNNIQAYTINRNHTYKNINLTDNLENLVKKCDVIICSLPKTTQTNDLFNQNIFKLMKDKYLINVGRSNVINQKDLYNALKNKQIKGVAIDTWDEKPKTKSQILYPSQYDFNTFDNIILLPHAATRTKDGHKLYVQDTTQKIINYITKNTITDAINYQKGY